MKEIFCGAASLGCGGLTCLAGAGTYCVITGAFQAAASPVEYLAAGALSLMAIGSTLVLAAMCVGLGKEALDPF
jgi:hypothetical protein